MGHIKAPTTVDQQLATLSGRGMIIDEDQFRQWVANVSYYRLSGYWYPYRMLSTPKNPRNPQRLDKFEDGTKFSEVVALYEFDRKMRTLIHDGMERIEVAMRTRIGELLVTNGALSYKDSSWFSPSFDHAEWVKTVGNRVGRAKRRGSRSIEHYDTVYGDYPFWVVADVLDFSDISRLYEGMLDDDQRLIAKSFGLAVDPTILTSGQRQKYYHQEPLVRWCEQLTLVRNACAHHSRLWNSHFIPASTSVYRTVPGLESLAKEGQSEKLYGALLMMSFMLRSISPGSSWPTKVRSLVVNEYIPLEYRSLEEMGFPDGWGELGIWN